MLNVGWTKQLMQLTLSCYSSCFLKFSRPQTIPMACISLIHFLGISWKKLTPGKRFTGPEGLPWRSKTKLANTGNVMWLWCVSRIVWPGGGSVWRGFPAIGDTLTPPACVGPGLPRHHSCDRAQPHRCSPEGSMAHRGTRLQRVHVRNALCCLF